jgi:hypothetical protein
MHLKAVESNHLENLKGKSEVPSVISLGQGLAAPTQSSAIKQ